MEGVQLVWGGNKKLTFIILVVVNSRVVLV